MKGLGRVIYILDNGHPSLKERGRYRSIKFRSDGRFLRLTFALAFTEIGARRWAPGRRSSGSTND